uniref:Putative ovule protein n=1 Tax=Solanum chacoense TaxID=4108 RepID=A0A0V0GX30_SOLCH
MHSDLSVHEIKERYSYMLFIIFSFPFFLSTILQYWLIISPPPPPKDVWQHMEFKELKNTCHT